MSVYMTEEEQLDAIKKWWKRYSSHISIALSIILLAIAGYKYWNWHIEKTTQQASNAYEHLMVAFSNKDNKQTQAYANELIHNYDSTVYADIAHMTRAKLLISSGMLKKAQEELQIVASKSSMPALKQVAKIRLARILLAQQKYSQALEALDPILEASYIPVINELRGDIYVATRKYPQAIASYRKAIHDVQAQGIGNLFLEMKTNELAAMTHSLKINDKHKKTA